MTAPPFLVVQNRTTVKVFRVTGGATPAQIGNNVSASAHTGTDSYYAQTNHVIEWRGDLYLWHGDDVYIYNSGTSNWDAQGLALSIASTNTGRNHTGLYRCAVGNRPRLIGFFAGSTANELRYLTFDGTTWTEGSFGVVSFGPSGFGPGIVYRNSLFVNVDSEHVIQFDPSGPSYTQYTWGYTSQDLYAGFGIFEGRLLAVRKNTSNARLDLFEFLGGGFSSVQRLGSSITSPWFDPGNSARACAALFEKDGDFFVVLAGRDGASAQGNFALRLVKSGAVFTESDLSTTWLPASIRAGGGSADENDRWDVLVDNDTDPANPTVHLWHHSRWDGAVTHYEVVDLVSALVSGGTGLSYELVLSDMPEGGGGRIWSSGARWIDIDDIRPTGGGMEVDFYVGSDSATVEVEFRHNADEEAPSTLMPLVAGTASGGSMTNTAAKCQNVTADGSTLYTVTIDTPTAGLLTGEKDAVMPFVDVSL